MKSTTTPFFRTAIVLMGLFFSLGLVAQDRPLISVQGTLKDINGVTVADGQRSFTFRLYPVESGGTSLWEEIAQVDVNGGIYSHNLGSVTPLNESNFAQTVFLGITVDGNELSPRTTLTYAPYALSVTAAQRIARGGCSGQVGDVKYSILNPTQFAAQNGDCWVPMDGRAMTGSTLAGILGGNNVPDMSGLFIRATEYNDGNDPDRAPMAAVSLQQDNFGSHNHDFSGNTEAAGEHSHSIIAFSSGSIGPAGPFTGDGVLNNADGFPYVANTLPAENHVHSFGGATVARGGSETRSKNLNFYAYIRID